MGTRDVGAGQQDGRLRKDRMMASAQDSQQYIPWLLVAGALILVLLIGHSLQTVRGSTSGSGSARNSGALAAQHYLCIKQGYLIAIPAGWIIAQPCEAQFGLRVESADHLSTFEVAVYARELISENDIKRILIEAAENEGATTSPSISSVTMDNSPFVRALSTIATDGPREVYETRSGLHSGKMYILTLRVLRESGGDHAAVQNKEIWQAYTTIHFL